MRQPAKRRRVAILRGLWPAALFVVMNTAAKAQSLPTRHVRQEVTSGEASFSNPLPKTQSLRLNIALPLRNESELDDLLQRVYDPQSPVFHQFLSVQEFTDKFGPTEQDYAAVVRFAEENGLTVTGAFSNRLVLNVTGSVANIEKAFQMTLGSYRHPTEQRMFYSPDREPSAAGLTVPPWHISGLDNFSIPRPASLYRDLTAQGNTSGSGPGGNFLGSDMRAAYYGGRALTGAGQSVGLLEFAGYEISDVRSYFRTVDTNADPMFGDGQVVGVSTDGSSLSCSGRCHDTEQVLDIEEAISMAPDVQVFVYVSDTSDVSIFARMATDNLAKSLSCSWGWSPADPSSDDPLFKEFAIQGQNLFVASGDSGAYKTKSRFVYPADDAYVTSVGGTDLTTNGAGGAWASETSWSGSGGGISPSGIPIPGYQAASGVITAANGGSHTLRNAPDVAAEARTDNYICYDGHCAGGWGGTSFAAPRWAGYMALVNQRSVANLGKPVGFINPAIYTLGLGLNSNFTYSSAFHDITGGSNGTYSAEKGFDLVTGWGSPNSAGLIRALGDQTP